MGAVVDAMTTVEQFQKSVTLADSFDQQKNDSPLSQTFQLWLELCRIQGSQPIRMQTVSVFMLQTNELALSKLSRKPPVDRNQKQSQPMCCFTKNHDVGSLFFSLLNSLQPSVHHQWSCFCIVQKHVLQSCPLQCSCLQQKW